MYRGHKFNLVFTVSVYLKQY